MNWTVITGVIIALMFLVSFSQWFYELVSGFHAAITQDLYVAYRTGVWVTGGIVFMIAVFWVLAMVQECPDLTGDKPGVFAYMDCRVYWQVNKLLTGQQIPNQVNNPDQSPSDNTQY